MTVAAAAVLVALVGSAGHGFALSGSQGLTTEVEERFERDGWIHEVHADPFFDERDYSVENADGAESLPAGYLTVSCRQVPAEFNGKRQDTGLQIGVKLVDVPRAPEPDPRWDVPAMFRVDRGSVHRIPVFLHEGYVIARLSDSERRRLLAELAAGAVLHVRVEGSGIDVDGNERTVGQLQARLDLAGLGPALRWLDARCDDDFLPGAEQGG